ncbi:hypothetical protein [Rhodococcus daqingensis]|uniref:Integral membrane protein n=1 Tax=Rhodococcus daqingensis TaxID=2479363 RepID=A0ABW2S242_9NOCA
MTRSGDVVRPGVLELRIHGVSNTPPYCMLDVQPDEVRRVGGDDLASFWTVKADVAAELTADQRGYTPPGIRREAYSWGALARTTSGGVLPVYRKLLAIVIRAAWCLVLPYGLTNLAYWARDLGASPRRVFQSAAAVRLVGLALTLLFVSTVVTVCSDLIALQYLHSGIGRLPTQIGVVAEWTPARRLAASMLVPVIAVALLWSVAWRSRSRYDVDTSAQDARVAADTPVVRRNGFWNNTAHATETALIHAGASVAAVVAMTALFVPPDGQPPARWSWATAAVAGAAILGAVVRLIRTSANAADVPVKPASAVHWTTWVVLGVSGAAFVAHALLLALGPGSGVPNGQSAARLEGLIAIPATLLVLLLVPALAFAARGKKPLRAWGGRAVGVFLLLALGTAMLLSNLVVVGVGNWLNGTSGAADLVASGPVRTAETIHVPEFFAWFGVGLVVSGALVLASVPVFATAAVRWAAALPSARPAPAPGTVTDPSTAPARLLATAAHRAEPLVGILAVLTLVSLLPCLLFAGWQIIPWVGDPIAPQALTDLGVLPATVLVVALAGALILRPDGARPLGIVWDLLCIVPRAAHPFGPPSYSERAVPELVTRCESWLSVPGRKVVLSAHSIGSVLAAAVILDPRSAALIKRGALLTYGSQLRAYFGRIFPELFGPDVLATVPARAARLFGADEFRDDTSGGRPAARRQTLVGLLRAGTGETRWINLWRETDYLGFPAYSRAANYIDVTADEIDRSGYLPTVASHSGYVRTPQYREALDELVRRIGT